MGPEPNYRFRGATVGLNARSDEGVLVRFWLSEIDMILPHTLLGLVNYILNHAFRGNIEERTNQL